MDDWENFSAFGDIGELEHVAYLLEECAAGELSPGCLDDLAGDDSYLLKRLNIQAAGTARLLEAKRPGLYERTWIAGIFGALFNELHDVVGKPRLLPACLPSIVLNMHKVFIAAHDVFNPFHLERMISESESQGRQGGLNEAKEARSQASKNAVKMRTDQRQKSEFIEWAKGRVALGDTPSNIDEVQGLDGFDPAWSQRNQEVLKRWSKEAGFSFKAGRPRKKQ